MKKLFQKYNRLIPVIIFLYGIYAWTRTIESELYRYSDRPLENVLEIQTNGWDLMVLLFVIGMTAMIFRLREDKKWEYIYSFPITKKQIFRDVFYPLYANVAVAAGIYSFFYGMKLYELLEKKRIEEILLATLLSISLMAVKCMIAQVCFFACAKVSQAIVIFAVILTIGLTGFVNNLGYLIQSIGNIAYNHVFMYQIFYQQSDIRIPERLNFQVLFDNGEISEKMVRWPYWNHHYIVYMLLLIGITIGIAVLCWHITKQWFVQDEVSKNCILTRLDFSWNRRIIAFITAICTFACVTTMQYMDVFTEDVGIREWIRIILKSKSYIVMDLGYVASRKDTLFAMGITCLVTIVVSILITRIRRGGHEKYAKI